MSTTDNPPTSLQPVIGLEVHCQLQTQTRLFSTSPVGHDEPPNHLLQPYDLGMPGTLPVLNERAVDLAVRAGLALDCEIHRRSHFDRKHYFYPDLPRGYQITQYTRPLCTGGVLRFDRDGREHELALRRIHLEEDAAKSIHSDATDSKIDYNRAGTPLIEIVTEPALHSPESAESALRALHRLVIHLGICDGNLNQGSFRCDANISMRCADDSPQNELCEARTELKNLNSFRYVRRALQVEIQRQTQALEQGRMVRDETRRYDAISERTVPLRSKEGAPDYRYMPDPDLPEVVIDEKRLQTLRDDLGELPRQRHRRLMAQFELGADDAQTLLISPTRADFFEAATTHHPTNPQGIANIIIHQLLGYLDDDTAIDDLGISAADIAGLVALIDDGTVSSSAASTVLEELLHSHESPQAIVDRLQLRQIGDRAELSTLIQDILDEHAYMVRRYEAGETNLFGFFMGRVMDHSSGRADPQKASQLLRELLEQRQR